MRDVIGRRAGGAPGGADRELAQHARLLVAGDRAEVIEVASLTRRKRNRRLLALLCNRVRGGVEVWERKGILRAVTIQQIHLDRHASRNAQRWVSHAVNG